MASETPPRLKATIGSCPNIDSTKTIGKPSILEVGKTKAYQIVGHKTFPFKISQIIKHSQKIMEQLRINNKFFMIVHIYIISNLAGGRQVYVVRDKGYEIFFVHRNYFPVWLNNLKKVYLGIPCIEGVNYYMGGK